MSQIDQDAILLAKDLRFGDDEDKDRTGPAQPVSQAEIDDLLYNEELGTADRLGRLRQFRERLSADESVDFGDGDSRDVVGEIDGAIARIEGAGVDGSAEVAFDIDPADHRETLSPDDDLLEAIEAEDEDDEKADIFGDKEGELGEVLDPVEWEEDGDGVDSEKGVN